MKMWARWNASDYLKQYYVTPTVPSDELAIYKKIIPFLNTLKRKFEKAIEIGAGPTIHHAIPIVPYVKELHLADLLQQNLDEIDKWLTNHPLAHNWETYFKGVLHLEGKDHPKHVQYRKKEIKNKITELKLVDLTQAEPLGVKETYDLVCSFYCADSAAQTKTEWRKMMLNLFSLVDKKSGAVIISALRNAVKYKVGKYHFPSANINESDILSIFLESGFSRHDLDIHVSTVPEWKEEGFESIIVATAHKLKT